MAFMASKGPSGHRSGALDACDCNTIIGAGRDNGDASLGAVSSSDGRCDDLSCDMGVGSALDATSCSEGGLGT
jgi:hypothetical protein